MKSFDSINIVPKCFETSHGGLGRARKYGMDYSLYCLSKLDEKEIDDSFIISNEGDTLSIPEDYVKQYKDSFSRLKHCFIQGKVVYPEEVNNSRLVKIYSDVRECVHMGQGMNDDRYPFFDGIMPVGRNYAVHPRVASLAGGIDPVYLDGAEDDLTFGTDIHLFLGNESKKYIGIPLITNPRREIIIVRNLLFGGGNDAKKMYEDFHNIASIYDYDWPHYKKILIELSKIEVNNKSIIRIINQFYQWVFRTVIKNYFVLDEGFQNIISENRDHILGYWEKENMLLQHYEKVLCGLNEEHQVKFLKMVKIESLNWFNELIYSIGLSFVHATDGLDSSLSIQNN